MGKAATISCSGCELSAHLSMGPMMSGIEYTSCACTVCAGFVILEHGCIGDDPRPDPVCPTCAAAVTAVEVHGGRVVERPPGDWRDGDERHPLEEQPTVACPACGGELTATHFMLID